MKQWRVGTISMGFLLITLGVLLLGNTIWQIPINSIIIYGWPLILISIGVEVLIFSFRKSEQTMRFDLFSIFVIFITIMFTFFVYTVQSSGIISAISNAIQGETFTIELKQSLDIPANVKEVLVEIPNGDVNITNNKTNKVQLEGLLRINATDKQNAEFIKDNILVMQTIGNKAIIRIERPNDAKFMGNQDVSVDLAIALPDNLIIRGLTKNGDILLNGYTGTVNIESYNGDVEIEDVIGELNVESKNGDISISSVVGGNWDLNNINGDIDLDLPSDTNAYISAETRNGDIDGNIDWKDASNLKENGHVMKRFSKLGSGKYNISMISSNNDIDVNLR